ncbi:hypothetical protein ETU10_06975 [Apibacter muscae]|uniref:hypothetical protein n=1 Tax=Apibacter muscae TaxID=2509004 RepID=UPI0011ABF8CA|nr:hypothetical protein [Apibacter muscae]TWP23464.1 hypothetical protein ETU10_06975 [Apibacter muscae]
MKKTLLLLVGGIMLTSCNKKGWDENDKKEYVNACVESALNKFKENNMAADTAKVKTLCECSAEGIIDKGQDIKRPSRKVMFEVTQECAKK